MQKLNLGKKLVSVAAAAAMAVTATASTVSSMAVSTASAASYAELFGSVDFNNGVGLPWHICENATGEMEFVLIDGQYVLKIVNPGGESNSGVSRWDCQFRHRGLTIRDGETYRITFSIWNSKPGTTYPKLGDITNDDLEFWHGNGKQLSLDYMEGASQEELESALASASATGTEIPYYEWGDSWKKANVLSANEWHTFAYEFTVNKSDINNTTWSGLSEGTAEMTFHLGGDGEYSIPGGMMSKDTIVKFDNMALINMSGKDGYVQEEEYVPTGLELNQVGYYPNLDKKATIEVASGDKTAKPFEVKDSSGTTVYTGTSSDYGEDPASLNCTQILDFSEFKTPGTGYTVVCDGKTSLPFDIGDDIYSGMLKNALNYFYQNRSGIEIESKYITSQGENASKEDLAREAGHVKDVAYIQKDWTEIYKDATEIDQSQSIDVTGGWYDAGDHGKYVVNGGISVWTLNNLFERSVYNGDTSKWEDGTDTMLIPESGNKIPDILDEVKYELEFIKKMMRDDGMVYHKMHDYKWTALCVRPAEDPLERIVKPVTYAATLNAAAAFAQSARLFEKYDSSYASELTTLAKKCYSAAVDNYSKNGSKYSATDLMFAPIEDGKGGGAYGDTYVDDDFYWAASELYATTGDSTYLTDVKAYKDSGKCTTVLTGGENKGTNSSWTWGTTASCGTISLALNTTGKVDSALSETCKASVREAGDTYVAETLNSQYGTAYEGCQMEFEIWQYDPDTGSDSVNTMQLDYGYEWGSNSMVANNAIVMALAYDFSDGDAKYINGVSSAFDYLLGRNPMEQSYVTGYGEHHTRWPHHRFWSHYNDASFPYCPDGVLSGGPNSQMQDPMIAGAGYVPGTRSPMECYYDQLETWSVNECTINWNSPLAYIVSFLEDEAPNVTDSSVKVTLTPSTIDVGDSATVTATVNGSDVTNITISSSDEKIAKVEGGKVVGVSAGKAVITVQTADGSKGTATITVEGEATSETEPSSESESDTSDLPEANLYGDVNVDKNVNVADVILLNKYIVGSGNVTPQGLANAACYDDGKIDINDSAQIMNVVVMTLGQTDLPIKP